MGNIGSASSEEQLGARALPRGAWSEADNRAVCGALEATRKAGGGVVVIESGKLKLSIAVTADGVQTSPASDGASAYRAAATVAVFTLLVSLVLQAGAGAAYSGGGMLETLFSPGVENVVGWWHWKMMEAVWSSLIILLVPHLHDDVRQALADIRHALSL